MIRTPSPRGRVGCVAGDCVVGALDQYPLAGVAVDQVVLNDGPTGGRDQDADGVAVDFVEVDRCGAGELDAGGVVVDVVRLPGRPTRAAERARTVKTRGVTVDRIAVEGGGDIGVDADVAFGNGVVEDTGRAVVVDSVTAGEVGDDRVFRNSPGGSAEIDAVGSGAEGIVVDDDTASTDA